MKKANLSWLFKAKPQALLILNVTLLIVLFITLSKPDPVKSAIAEHIVISEVQIEGATAGDEFVELYNPTGSDMDLTGWRLARKTSGTSSANLVTSINGTIPAHGYFLIAPATYTGSVSPDQPYSPAGTRISENNTIYLYGNDSASLVDKVAVGDGATDGEGNTAPLPGDNQSIERKAKSSSTAQSMDGTDADEGNGEDSDDNASDFILRIASQPQNSTSSAEIPSAAPTPSPSATATASASPSAFPSISPSPSATGSASPSPSATASASPSMSPSASASASPSMSPSASPSASPAPKGKKLVCKFEPFNLSFGKWEFTLYNLSCKTV
jgi:hypothetical protein